MALLTLVIPPAHAISLLVIPILFTNLTQFSRSKYRMEAVKTYWLFAIAIIISIFFDIALFVQISNWASDYFDWLCHDYCVLEWIDWCTVKLSDRRIWQLGFGVLSGVLAV